MTTDSVSTAPAHDPVAAKSVTARDVRAMVAGLDGDAADWHLKARARVSGDAGALSVLFPAVGRKVGRGPLDSAERPSLAGWTVDDAARADLLLTVAEAGLRGHELAAQTEALYRHGDAAERRGVLRALPLLDVGDRLLPVVEDALRTNDTRLVSAAVGPYAARLLGDAAWRHAVLKCVFVGVPLADVADLERRADDELARMCVDFARERVAAGRPIPNDIWLVLGAFPERRREAQALENR